MVKNHKFKVRILKKYYKQYSFFFIDAQKVTGKDPIIRQILSLDIKGVRPV